MLDKNLLFSRSAGTAAALGSLASERHQIPSKKILIMGEETVLRTANGQQCFLDSIRLLIRVFQNVTVCVPEGLNDLHAAARTLIDRIAMPTEPKVLIGNAIPLEYDAVLSTGTRGAEGTPITVINSNGWIARVSSSGKRLPDQCSEYNPIGAFGAACLGASEIFKRAISLDPERGPFFDGLEFNFYNYSCSVDEVGPAIGDSLELNATMVGAGAIGNGVIHLLSLLPFRGKLRAVDNQAIAVENMGTYICAGIPDIGKAKTDFCREQLPEKIQVEPFQMDLADFLKKVSAHTGVFLGCVDNIQTRHEIQKVWPDLVIDGGIGPLECRVSRHPWREDSACMLCAFPEPSSESWERVASRLTGLSADRVKDADSVVDENDIQTAPEERRQFLLQRKGQRICSVIPEAHVEILSKDTALKGITPSVPFVACLSACMIVGELVKVAMNRPTALESQFQMDVLQGPERGCFFPQRRQEDCMCKTRAKNIEVWRSSRYTSI